MSVRALASIVAVGARTPLGLDARQTGFLLRAGFAAIGEAPLGEGGAPIAFCRQTALDASLMGFERVIALAEPALRELLRDLRATTVVRVKLLLCVDPPDPSQPHASEPVAHDLLAIARREYPNATLEIAARGEASACFALPRALAALDSRQLDCVILGGVHSAYDALAIARLAEGDRLYGNDHLDAILPGESAAFVALVAPSLAARRNTALAHVAGMGSAIDEARFSNDVPAALARGATAALRAATQPLLDGALRAGWVLSDIAFEVWRQREWQSLIVRAADVLGPPYQLDCPAQRIGSLGAAALPLSLALACEAYRAGYAPSPFALALAGSEAGERGAIVVAGPAPSSRGGG